MEVNLNKRMLWAPWRIEYILSEKKVGSCAFCDALNNEDAKQLILKRGKYCFVILNTFPYNPGHLMVVPYMHTSNFSDLTKETHEEISAFESLSLSILNDVMHPEGYNIGMNMGRAAGAGITDHLHVHIVPRWNGDTNFMPVISSTRIVSEALMSTYNKLSNKFKEMK